MEIYGISSQEDQHSNDSRDEANFTPMKADKSL
jgi:hypothetical protein